MTTPQPSPGWYPHGPVMRWWDGERWTEHTHTRDVEPARKASTSALWSMIIGIFGLFFTLLGIPFPLLLLFGLPTLIGLPLALVAMGDIRRGATVGKGMAWAGLIANGLVWVLWVLVIIGAAAA